MIFFHLRVFFYTNKCFIIYTGYNLRNTQRDGGNPVGLRKPTTRTRENPHLRSRVWVSTGTGAGCPEKPQGSPSHSLLMVASIRLCQPQLGEGEKGEYTVAGCLCTYNLVTYFQHIYNQSFITVFNYMYVNFQQ